MRLLLDENFPKPIVDVLRSDRHDVLWARECCQGWKDPRILEFAESEGRVLLTLDKDFWQLAIQRKAPLRQSGVVLFRVHPSTPENLRPLVHAFLLFGKTWNGHISVMTPEGLQMIVSRK